MWIQLLLLLLFKLVPAWYDKGECESIPQNDEGSVDDDAVWNTECSRNRVMVALYDDDNSYSEVDFMKCCGNPEYFEVDSTDCEVLETDYDGKEDLDGGDYGTYDTWNAQCPKDRVLVALYDGDDNFKDINAAKCCSLTGAGDKPVMVDTNDCHKKSLDGSNDGGTNDEDKTWKTECEENYALVALYDDDDGFNEIDKIKCCRINVCGDGILERSTEECDEELCDTCGCLNHCSLNVCGDGYLYDGVEECDNGDDNDNFLDCTLKCRLATCGDGYMKTTDSEETCDVENGLCIDCRLLPHATATFTLNDVENERFYRVEFHVSSIEPSINVVEFDKFEAEIEVELNGVYTFYARYTTTDISDNTAVITMADDENGLSAGSSYRWRVSGRYAADRLDREWSDFTSWEIFSIGCGCSEALATTGEPVETHIFQSFEHVYIEWTDDSTCEREYNIWMHGNIVDGFRFRGSNVCGDSFQVKSSLEVSASELLLGHSYAFCIQAVDHDAEYQSGLIDTDPDVTSSDVVKLETYCDSLEVQFYSKLLGSVKSQSQMPVENIEILVIHEEGIFAGVTDETGEYEVYLQYPSVSEHMTVMVIPYYAPSSTRNCAELEWNMILDGQTCIEQQPESAVSHAQAVYACRSEGARLCFFSEIQEASKEGLVQVGADVNYWVQDLGCLYRESMTSGAAGCRPSTDNFAIMCCADKVVNVHAFESGGDELMIGAGVETTLTHLESGEVMLTDLTVFSISGTVFIDGTGKKCPASTTVEVCAYDQSNPDNALVCDELDEDGMFFLSVPAFSEVYIYPHYNVSTQFEHVFEPENSHNGLVASEYNGKLVYTLVVTENLENVIFLDVTKTQLQITLAGGECDTFLFPAYFSVTPFCGFEVSDETQIVNLVDEFEAVRVAEYSNTVTVQVPSMDNVMVRLEGMVELDFSEEFALEYDAYHTQVMDRIRALTQESVAIALEETPSHNVVFTYRDEGQISVLPLYASSEQPCWGETSADRTDGYYTQELEYMEQFKNYTISVEVLEHYGPDVNQEECRRVSGDIYISDQLSDASAECHESRGGCTITMNYSSFAIPGREFRSGSIAQVDILPMEPDVLSPYLKRIQFEWVAPGQSGVKLNYMVVVTGSKERTAFASIKYPEYVPMLMLRRPPGGDSEVELSTGHTISSSWGLNVAHEIKGSIEKKGGVASKGKFDLMVGAVAAYTGQVVVENEGKSLTGNAFEAASSSEDENQLEVSYTMQERFTTPSNIFGTAATMYAVPALSIRVIETDVIGFDSESCSATQRTSYQWTMLSDAEESEAESTSDAADMFGREQPDPNTLMWYSQYDLEMEVIPNLQTQLDDMQELLEDPGDAAAEEVADAAQKIPILEGSIIGWQNTIAMSDELVDQSKSADEKFLSVILPQFGVDDEIAAWMEQINQFNSDADVRADFWKQWDADKGDDDPDDQILVSSLFSVTGNILARIGYNEIVYTFWLYSLAAMGTNPDPSRTSGMNPGNVGYSGLEPEQQAALKETLKSDSFASLLNDCATQGGTLDLRKAKDLANMLEEQGLSDLFLEDGDFNGLQAEDWKLEDLTMMSFTGGGQVYSYTFTGSTTQEYSWQFADHSDWAVKGEIELENVYASTVGFEYAGETAINWVLTKTRTKKGKSSKDRSISVSFADPDVGDSFDVRLLVDPVYGTPIFETISGYSKCVWEENTVRRENPDLSLEGKKLFELGTGGGIDQVPPDEKVFRTLWLENLAESKEAASYMITVNLGTNPDGLEFTIDGEVVTTDFKTGELPAERNFFELGISRGPTVYEYRNVEMCAVSECDGSASSCIDISIQFVQACSQVVWSGDMARYGEAKINSLSTSDIVKLNVKNPVHQSLTWIGNSRLQSVNIRYRSWEDRGDEYAWTFVYDEHGSSDTLEPYNLMGDISSAGYAGYWWNVADLPDGIYEVTVTAFCEYSFDLDDEFNFAETSRAQLTIDRTPPFVFHTQIATEGELRVDIEFDEAVRCDSITVSSWLTDTREDLDSHMFCELRMVSVVFTAAVFEFVGRKVTIELDKILDHNGNPGGTIQLNEDPARGGRHVTTLTVPQRSWECSVPETCDESLGVSCDYPDINTVCEGCDAGWYGNLCECTLPENCHISATVDCVAGTCDLCMTGYALGGDGHCQPIGHFVALRSSIKGDQTEDCVHVLEVIEFSCCGSCIEDDDSFWKGTQGSDEICATSKDSDDVCFGARAHSDAAVTCDALGGYLCSVEEIQADEARGSGCNLDSTQIWSRDTCTLP